MNASDQATYIYALFSQDEFWIDAGGTKHRVTGMDERYRGNVRRFLERRAGALEVLFSFGEAAHTDRVDTLIPPGEMAQYYRDKEFEAEWERRHEDPVVWLRSTPLYQALRESEAVPS